MEIFVTLILGKVYQALGQLKSAHQTHQKALARNEQVKSDIHAAFIRAELCADCALAGNWAEATTHARQALAYRRYDVLPLVISSRWLETEALLRGSEVRLAREDARKWGELVGHIPRFHVPHLRSLAVLAEWDGNSEQAIAHLQEALALAEKIGLPGEQWQILAKLGGVYQESGNVDRAREVWSKATETIQSLAATIEDEDLRTAFLATTLV